MRMLIQSKKLAACAAAAAAVSLCLTACGRGPVEQITSPQSATITIQLFVQGQITPSQGDYIIALNENANGVNLNNAATGEQPGEPTILEAYGLRPPPFTHWDQAIVYGSNSSGLPNCLIAPPPPNGFNFCYKSVSQNGGVITIKFIPIILTPNTYTFNPNGNGGSGTGNAMILKLPLPCLSIFGGADSFSCDSVTSTVTQIYLNFVTLDTTGAPQDQLACIAGQTYSIDVTFTHTQPLIKPTNCQQPPPPPNQNLLITGGFVQVIAPPSPTP